MAGPAQRVHSIFKVKAGGRTRLVVFDTQDLTLGRAPENDLAIEDPEMSRKHVVFRRSSQGCRLEDQNTSNGTQVNGTAVAQAALAHGDVIRIGVVEITYAETTRNPASLGQAVEYASQLKSFASPLAGDTGGGEATILGLMDVADAAGDDDEPFEVRPAGEFDFGLHEESAAKPRDLDAALADLDADPLDFDFEAAAAPEEDTARAAKPRRAPAPVPAPAQAWELDDAPAAPKQGPLTLTLEIDGLDGELRQSLQGLVGKVLRLPALKLRIKGEDLG